MIAVDRSPRRQWLDRSPLTIVLRRALSRALARCLPDVDLALPASAYALRLTCCRFRTVCRLFSIGFPIHS